jgi:integrase
VSGAWGSGWGSGRPPKRRRALLQAPDASSLKGKRDRAILAVLIGCALRRGELVGLTVADLQQRDGRAVFVDISGKGGRVRTVPVPDWVEVALQAWLLAAGIAEGRIFRAISRWGSVVGERLSTTAVLGIVAEYAALLSLQFSPTTCGGPVPNSAGSPGAPSSRSSFCWGMRQSRRPSATWVGSRSSRWRSTTNWGWDCPKGLTPADFIPELYYDRTDCAHATGLKMNEP